MIKLTNLQSKVYEHVHAMYAGQDVALSTVGLAAKLRIHPVTFNHILRTLCRKKMLVARNPSCQGVPNIYFVPKRMLAYENVKKVDIFAVSRQYNKNGMEGSKQRVLDLINKNATPDRATSWKLTQNQIAAALGLSRGYVALLIKELVKEGKVVKGNHTDAGGKATVYDQANEIAVQINGKHALIRGKFTVSFPPNGA